MHEAGHALTLVVHERRPEIPAGKTVKYHEADLLDPTLFRNAGFKCDVAVNLAGVLRRPGIQDETYWKVHYESTKHILEECLKFNIKHFLLVSTTGVYGATGRSPRKEDGPYGPSDIYEKTKLEAERYALEQCKVDKVGLTILRPALVYGPGDTHLLRLYRAIAGGYFRIIGDGSNLLHPIFIDDLVEGMTRCLPGEGSPPAREEARVYNLAGERPVAFGEFCETIAKAIGKKKLPGGKVPTRLALAAGGFFEVAHKVTRLKPPLTRETVKFMTSDRAYDISRARKDLGWEPRVGLEEGIDRTVAWYREKGLLG